MFKYTCEGTKTHTAAVEVFPLVNWLADCETQLLGCGPHDPPSPCVCLRVCVCAQGSVRVAAHQQNVNTSFSY